LTPDTPRPDWPLQASKTDRNDARGLAQTMRTGWFREVRIKSTAAHLLRALLASRGMLVATRCALENQIRGVLKTFGLVLGKVGRGRFETHLHDLLAAEPRPGRLVTPLLEVRRSLFQQIEQYDRMLVRIARHHTVVRRLMTVPGVGAVTALAFVATVDDPTRFSRSRHVGAYLGLAPRRYQSGEIDRPGHISKAGDRLVRTLLFEAANVLLTRTRQPSALKAWGEALAARNGRKKAKVALARKLAVLLHRLWRDGTTFVPDSVQAA
jgi:transposase